MKRFLLAAVAIVGLSLSASVASADHGYHGGRGGYHGGGHGHYHTGYYGGGHYHGHVHYGRAYPYGYYSSPVRVYPVYPPYYDDYYYPRQSFSYYGPGISFSIGR